MSSDVINQLIQSRFDVAFHSKEELLQAHVKYYGTSHFYENACRYFRERVKSLTQRIHLGNTVFSTCLFHALLGCYVTGQSPDKDDRKTIADYILRLRYHGGFLVVPSEYMNQFPKLRTAEISPQVPEVYSSYYSYFLLRMLDVTFSKTDLELLITWVIAHQKNTGAIYNDTYSNTPEERRFESEISSQTFFGVNLISSIARELPDSALSDSILRARDWALDRMLSRKTVAGRYFTLKIIHLVSPDEVGTLGKAEIVGFLVDRESLGGDGYYDYLLRDKVDDFMSSSSLTELDKISPHVFSTYYATSILKMLWYSGASLEVSHDRIKRLAEKAANTDNGFGMKVLVKDFEEPYGPVSTELETVLILLLPLLAQDIPQRKV